MEAKQVGRPAMDPHLKRTATLVICLRPEEREAVAQLAARRRIPPGVWARHLVEDAIRAEEASCT
jgi:hypothetical protein